METRQTFQPLSDRQREVLQEWKTDTAKKISPIRSVYYILSFLVVSGFVSFALSRIWIEFAEAYGLIIYGVPWYFFRIPFWGVVTICLASVGIAGWCHYQNYFQSRDQRSDFLSRIDTELARNSVRVTHFQAREAKRFADDDFMIIFFRLSDERVLAIEEPGMWGEDLREEPSETRSGPSDQVRRFEFRHLDLTTYEFDLETLETCQPIDLEAAPDMWPEDGAMVDVAWDDLERTFGARS